MVDIPSMEINPGAAQAPHLPGLPTPRVADLQVGTPQVTTPQLAQLPSPLREVASSLSKASDETNEVAKLYAKQAGYQAVTRDSDGNLVVAQAPIVGDAAIAFHSAVKFSALSMGEAEAKRKDLVLSKQYHDNPDGYLEAAQAFQKDHVAEFTKAAGADVGAMLGRSIDNNTSQNYRWLVLEQQRNIKQQFDQGTKASIQSTEEDAISVIQTGGQPGDPTLRGLIDKRINLSEMRVQNPVLSSSKEVEALGLKHFDLRVGSALYVQGLNRILQDPNGGIGAAQEALESHLQEKGVAPAQRALDYSEGQKAIKDHYQNLERSVNIANKAQKASDQQFEDGVVQDSASPQPSITENDIKTAPGISPEAKMRMLAWQKRDGMPEPLARVSQANTTELFRRMNLPEDDPQRINDLRPIRDAYAPASGGQPGLTRQDEDWLEKKFIESRSPDGSTLTKQKERVIKAAAFDTSTLMRKDSTGPLAEYNYRQYVDQRIEDYRKQGKDPHDLFLNTKPDFIGKPEIIQWFRASLDDHMKAMSEQINAKRGAPPPGLVVPGAGPVAPGAPALRQPGESINDFMKRTGKSIP